MNQPNQPKVGIVSYGFYLPKYRITTEEIAKTWNKDPQTITQGLKIEQKTVSRHDEDSLTMAFEACQMALKNPKIDYDKIGSVLFGSETPSYAVNPTSTILAEYLGIPNNYLGYDTQFACKAATGALVSSFAMVKSGMSQFGLVAGADKATGKPADALEFSAASGAVSLLVGSDDLLLELVGTKSYSSDTPDFWRRAGIKHPSHAGRFTGKPAYFKHIQGASDLLMEELDLKPEDFDRVVLHMPNGKFPLQAAKMLGFSKEQIEDALIAPKLGNSYAASALMGLVSTLEKAQPGELIFMCSYGSGAGSDAFVFRVTDKILERRQEFSEIAYNNLEYINYATYQNYTNLKK